MHRKKSQITQLLTGKLTKLLINDLLLCISVTKVILETFVYRDKQKLRFRFINQTRQKQEKEAD